MKLLLDRKYKKSTYTIGRLYVDNQYYCNTLEDKDRGLRQGMTASQIGMLKIPSYTAIPTGTYKVRMDIISPKYSTKTWYVKNCNNARVPRLENVTGFSGVLIHTGNTARDTDGCILVGKNTATGTVTQSMDTFLPLYKKMHAAYLRGETIYITIK